MPSRPRTATHLQPGDLRATLRLLNQGTQGLTRMVEGVHGAVLQGLGLQSERTGGRTRGITGLVYRSIEEVTGWVGQGTDLALAAWEATQPSDARPATPQREAALAALNGVLGDRLQAQGNPLATRMDFFLEGRRLDLQHPLDLPQAGPRVLLVLHGLCMNEQQWTPQGAVRSANHAQTLAAAMGATVVYVRYNTGLHISDNGRQLAALLDALQRQWPVPWQRLVVLAHSMGGLVARSAVAVAEQQELPWRQALRQMVFLGTPHHGAPLERAGHWLHALLDRTPYSAPFAALARMRSAGITDLRFGNVSAADWQAHDRFADGRDHRLALPLPQGVDCYAVAATLAARRSTLAERLLGDGLVPLHSALGQHAQPQRRLDFGSARQAIFYRTGHLALLSSQPVQAQLLQWLVPHPEPA